jgi:hypothetical protein
VSHLFFNCCVVKAFWEYITEVCVKRLGTYFDLVAKLWLNDKKNEMCECVLQCHMVCLSCRFLKSCCRILLQENLISEELSG